MPLLPVLKRIRSGVRAKRGGGIRLPAVDDISIGMIEIAPVTVEVAPFFQRELSNIGIAINPRKTVALFPKGHILLWKC